MNPPSMVIHASPGDALIGQSIGRYQITRELGRGGIGVVYEAVHQDIGQRMAVKVLSARLASSPQHCARFIHEARAGSLVHHPGLVRIFDFGRLADGRPYIMMEYLAGVQLRESLRRESASRLPWERAIWVARQIASALAALHAHGMLHCDLKPENVMLVPDPEVPYGERIKIVDFGIARIFSSRDESAAAAPGTRLGTPAYMSPEQCLGEAELSDRSDVYSLGALLYELLCGQPPFLGRDGSELAHKHVFELPLPLHSRSDVAALPRELDELVLQLLSKQPQLRPSAVQLCERLELLVPHHPMLPGSSAHGATGTGADTAEDRMDVPSPTGRGSGASVPPTLSARLAASGGKRLAQVALLLAALILIVRFCWRQESSMVRIPGGSFFMGSTELEVDAAFAWAQQAGCADCVREIYARELPMHHVSVSTFELDRTEVTNESYAAWLNRQPTVKAERGTQVYIQNQAQEQGPGILLLDLYPAYSYSGILFRDGRMAARPGMERLPVTQVTWEGARRYCAAQNKRLPTEAEWEYAARGEYGRRFPWGDGQPLCSDVVFGRESQGSCLHAGFGPAAVGTAAMDRTPLGVYDLGGNVAEWVLDCFRPVYAPCDGECTNPVVLSDENAPGRCTYRIVRGGAWFRAAEACRAAGRSRLEPHRVSGDIGFRCARSTAH